MKIGIIVSSLGIGGAEGVALRLAEGLSQLEHIKCDLIVLNRKVEYSAKVNLEVINKSYERGNKVLQILNKVYFHSVGYYLNLKKLKKRKNYDVVISFASLSNILNIKTKHNEKNILSLRNFYTREVKYMNKNFVKKLNIAYKSADHIITTSNDSKDDIVKVLGIDPSFVTGIYNPYQIETIKRSIDNELTHTNSGLDSGEAINILMVGRITEQKALWRGVKAMSLLVKEHPYAKLHIVGKIDGDSTYKVELESLIKELNLVDHIELLGFRKDVHKIMAQMDMFLMTSKWEGFPNALVEAMICGLPIVSVDCSSGPKEILGAGEVINFSQDNIAATKNGILIEQLSLENHTKEFLPVDVAIFNGLKHMINNESYRNSCVKHGNERVCDFSVNEVISKWLEVINHG